MSVLDINIATGLRADLEANKNKSLLWGASIALGSFYTLQNNISQMIEGLSNFEDINTPFENAKTKDKAKGKTKANAIPKTENVNPSNNNGDDSDKADEKKIN